MKYGHRLIPLCQRLTSFIEVRKPPEQYREYNEALLVMDGMSYPTVNSPTARKGPLFSCSH